MAASLISFTTWAWVWRGIGIVDAFIHQLATTIKQRFSENQPKGNKAITDVSTRCSSPLQGNNDQHAGKQSIIIIGYIGCPQLCGHD